MIEIRHAHPADAPAIASIAREIHRLHATALPEVFQPDAESVVSADDIEGLASRPGHLVLVALIDREVVGYAHAEIQKAPASAYKRATEVLHVHALGVSAEHRSRGVGHEIVQRLRREAAQEGVDGLSLEVYGFNQAALEFYSREGFTVQRSRLVWAPGQHRSQMDDVMRKTARRESQRQSATLNGYSFSERLRAILDGAQKEAWDLAHEYVGTEHLLLALMRDGDGVASAVFDELGVDRSRIEAVIEATVKRGKAPSVGERGKLPFTSRSKNVLELAMAEARELGHSHVGTEHLLLGLLREEKGIAAQVLVANGMRLHETRREVLRLLGPTPP